MLLILDLLFLLQLLLFLFLLLPGGLLRVRLQVRVQHRLRGERFVTGGTRVRSIPCVTSEMHHESGSLREPLVAVGTFMRPFAGVRAPVDAKVILRNETFTAQVAHVWFLAGVLAKMNGQVGLAGDGFPADGAYVLVLGANVPVSFHVHQEYLLPGETFVTELAVVLPLRRHVARLVQLRVQPQTLAVPERGVANLALERLLVGMLGIQVFLVTVTGEKARAAYLALIFVLVVVQFLTVDQGLLVSLVRLVL